MEGTLRLMDVPPDDIQSWLAAQAAGKVGGKPGSSAAPLPVPQDADEAPNATAEFDAALPTAVAPTPAATEVRQ